MKRQFVLTTPIGDLYIISCNSCVTRIAMSPDENVKINSRLTKFEYSVIKQLDEYFSGERKVFDFPFEVSGGTPFQQRVWSELRSISYGSTSTYGDIAKSIGDPKASRAVGAACNRNPLLLVVPCHRVIGKDANLVGFACGIEVKRSLLALEHSVL